MKGCRESEWFGKGLRGPKDGLSIGEDLAVSPAEERAVGFREPWVDMNEGGQTRHECLSSGHWSLYRVHLGL